MARIIQNRRIIFFSFSSFNHSEAKKKKKKVEIFNKKKKNLYDCQSIIKSTNVS